MLFRTTGFARRFLIGAALAGFACRAWIPAGYMPAPAADGGPVVLCPGGPGGGLIAKLVASRGARGIGSASHLAALEDHGAHRAVHDHHAAAHPAHPHHGNHHGGREDDGHAGFDASYCPLGAGAAFAALAPSFDVELLDLAFSLDAIAEAPIAARPALRAYESRAPPLV